MHTYTRRTVLGASIAAAGAGALGACTGSPSGSGAPSASGSPAGTATRTVSGSQPRPGPPAAAGPADRGSGHGTGHDAGRGTGSGDGFAGGRAARGLAGYVTPSGPEVEAAERERGYGPVRKFSLTATEALLDLGGPTVRTWAYDGMLPGHEMRITKGDTFQLTFANHLPQATTLHSHGIRLRCDMDGVPGLTQSSIRPGADFTYRFAVSHPGTYWVHSHSGMQLDRGLYAPLIVEDPREPLSYDKEWVVVLDDWVDGVDGSTPDAVFAELSHGRGMADMGEGTHGSGHGASGGAAGGATGPSRILHGARSRLLRSPGGHVAYPYYLVNGRVPEAPSVLRARPGDRIRLRIINAAAETAFRVALGGHEMTVTHTDGYPVRHTRTDALLLGMAERYDVLVTAKDGVFPLVALAEGKNAKALAVLRTGGGRRPGPGAHPAELDGRIVPASRLVPHDSVALCDRAPDRELRFRLTGDMKRFNWSFDRQPYSLERCHPIRQGERVRVTLVNGTDMWHPMHLHGHTFALAGIGSAGARKDTAVVLPHRKLVIDFNADNPGLWMLHCHNQYHSESGMMTLLGYRA
ncbi:multicopper oxidase family protein [Streptomyces antibioticus]|uniref:multicopper oxidase family protein n=1 Tax=Streptomyces antibioticus TaxID=1890 RepID=UPI002255E570|nr:multicopper oxidase family protein [Streptomyces antibioticus]MCX5169124.1 multicopper oxidase family protein [Streptomyces antibioticus]